MDMKRRMNGQNHGIAELTTQATFRHIGYVSCGTFDTLASTSCVSGAEGLFPDSTIEAPYSNRPTRIVWSVGDVVSRFRQSFQPISGSIKKAGAFTKELSEALRPD